MNAPAGASTLPDLANSKTMELSNRRSDLLASLTDQERNVLDLIALGLTNREIANQMFLSEKTVKNYVTRLLQKCQVRNRTEAAILTLQAPNPEW
jgi:RNA polymerase sigma factor (sigma-70 family)